VFWSDIGVKRGRTHLDERVEIFVVQLGRDDRHLFVRRGSHLALIKVRYRRGSKCVVAFRG